MPCGTVFPSRDLERTEVEPRKEPNVGYCLLRDHRYCEANGIEPVDLDG
jgi:hypothetical protein